ncbi:D-glycero-beta-D-manno-heptose 1,7-bisphosphate 7-phosphatase [Salinicola corii]|uniref:D,D-heptose 1,7-bisphosphate phosphatase n=1 Tax=Salinicola corii TaxID=2606937 RepID=A0A640WEU9_9GAMM|nr:D-glycero-beta-D-manno-heptose 1,7-bisphosphate 7-phosphatase [Salinicola corii]KAA0018654.1 D-glycero-beta-D-manno-heptose 1,7-bisphosphate 7-phosphatase [Salinicola corii]
MKLVILDRDGVINRDSEAYIKSLGEWHPYPDSIRAIARLHQKGWKVAIATNQSGIGRGYYTLDTLEAIHDRLIDLVEQAGGEISAIAYCPHRPEEACECRKPKPGMLLDIQKSLNFKVCDECWMVGDSLRDIQAGLAVGCRTALVETGNGIDSLDGLPQLAPEAWVCRDLASFVEQLLHNDHN